MKKPLLWLGCAVLLFLWLPYALAYESAPLPDGVKALCASAYPDYRIHVKSGGGDDGQGQFALILSKDGRNVLCVAEKKATDAAYVWTVNNDRALAGGDVLPSVLFDTGGDTLYFTYEEGHNTYRYHSQRKGGGWGPVDLIVYEDNDAFNCETSVWLENGLLKTHVACYDDEGTSEVTLTPIPAPWLAGQIALNDFDLSLLPRNPADGLPERYWQEAGKTLLPTGLTVLDGDDGPHALVLLAADAVGVRRVYLCEQASDGSWNTEASAPLPQDVAIDAVHDGDTLSIRFTKSGFDARYTFSRTLAGTWALSYIIALEDIGVGRYSLCGYTDGETRRYGVHPWTDIRTIDFASLPQTFSEACARLDPTGLAVITGDHPADRLNLRTAPEKGAPSIGKYYRGTVIRVLDTAGDWAYVDVYGVNGWMMSRFLATGAEMNAVPSAFPPLVIREERLDQGVNVYAAPEESAAIVETFNRLTWKTATIIGTAGDGWYHVVFEDNDSSGYLKQSCFWAGNG